MSLDKVNETCIFINSCDNTHDVAEYFLRSLKNILEIIYLIYLLELIKKNIKEI